MCWPFVDVVLEDPPKEPPKEYTMVSDKLNLVGVLPAKPEEPVNPWLASPPSAEAPTETAPHDANNPFVYYPRYTQHWTATAQPAEPANPWLASPPSAVKPVQPAQPASTYRMQAPLYYAGHPQPEPTRIWYGPTKAEVDAQNAALAHTVGASKPMELVPVSPTAGQQFYCRELDGAYTLRTMTDIETSCQPGSWHRASSGYPYFIRKAA